MTEIEFFGEIEEIQKNTDGVIRLNIIVRKAYSDEINHDRWLDIRSLYSGVEAGFKIKQKEAKNEEKFILAKENHERIYFDLVPKWNIQSNHPSQSKNDYPYLGPIVGYIIIKSPSMRFYKIYYKSHPGSVDLTGFVEVKKIETPREGRGIMITFEEIKDDSVRRIM